MTTTIGSLDLNALNDLYSDSNQYFWFESNSSATYGAGAHVTLVPDTTFISNPTGQNILMNTDGFSIRNGLLPMMTLDNDSLDFNIVDTTAGTYTTTATFTATSAQIGQSDGSQSYMHLDYHSLQFIDKEGDIYFHVSDLRDSTGYATLTATFDGDGTTIKFNVGMIIASVLSVTIDGVSTSDYTVFNALINFTTAPANGSEIVVTFTTASSSAKAYTLGYRNSNETIGGLSVAEGYNVTSSGYTSHAEGYDTTASGNHSHAEGDGTIASGNHSHAEGYFTTASGFYSHAEGAYTTASRGSSHAEGYETTASSIYSHAEGYNTTASGNDSHAEGHNTTASGPGSHAEGGSTLANGNYSHAEGNGTTASGRYSHAQNLGTIAANEAQTAIGKFNIEEIDLANQHALIIGNGTDDDHRSNALTIDWNGNVQAQSSILDRASTTAPSSSVYGSGFYANDKNGDYIARFISSQNSSNGMGALMIGAKEVNGTVKTNGFFVYVDASGNPHYWVANSANFRADMGCNSATNLTTGTLPSARLPVMFKVTTAKSSAQTINYNSGKAVTITAAAQSGYDLVGVVGVTSNHQVASSLGAAYVSSQANRQITVYVTNRNTSASGNFTDMVVTVYCLWALSNIY